LWCLYTECNSLLDGLGLGDYTGFGLGLVGCLRNDNGSGKTVRLV
jgi:hypothetical protein